MEIASFSRKDRPHIDNSYETDPSSPSTDVSPTNYLNESDSHIRSNLHKTSKVELASELRNLEAKRISFCPHTLHDIDENAVDGTFGIEKMKTAKERNEKHTKNVKNERSGTSHLSFNGKIENLSKNELPHKTKKKKTVFLGSPDIFADTDSSDFDKVSSDSYNSTNSRAPNPNHDTLVEVENCTSNLSEHTRSSLIESSEKVYKENCILECERLRRVKNCLSGVPPPPHLTMPEFDLFEAITSKKDEILKFLQSETVPSTPKKPLDEKRVECDLKQMIKFGWQPTHTVEQARSIGWRHCLSIRQHGLHYNFNKASEQASYLSMLVAQRFVGSETRSSFLLSPNSAKKRNMRVKMIPQSPGNRLSHLAKRRAAFSSANLATKSKNIFSNQIIISKSKAIKTKYKATPKRKTPTSKRKNPSSSTKKMSNQERIANLSARESSRRALFQSPANVQSKEPPKIIAKNTPLDIRKEKSQRALFTTNDNANVTASGANWTPSKASNDKLETFLKRKRDADDEESADSYAQSNKLFRFNNTLITPRSLNIKSKSFCNGADFANLSTNSVSENLNRSSTSAMTPIPEIRSSTTLIEQLIVNPSNQQRSFDDNSNSARFNSSVLSRSHSEQVFKQRDLSDNQKKKLVWAVSIAMLERKVDIRHEKFKPCAAVLARVVRRLFQEFYDKHSHLSNSEAMLHLAKKHAYSAAKGLSADDIYTEAKSAIQESLQSSKSKLTGYIAPKDYNEYNAAFLKKSSSTSNILNRIRTSTPNAAPQLNTNSPSKAMIDTVSKTISIGFENPTQYKSPSKAATIRPNPALQNSSSKSNFGGLALRENCNETELRRSAQKKRDPLHKSSESIPQLSLSQSTKAKRRINFDI